MRVARSVYIFAQEQFAATKEAGKPYRNGLPLQHHGQLRAVVEKTFVHPFLSPSARKP